MAATELAHDFLRYWIDGDVANGKFSNPAMVNAFAGTTAPIAAPAVSGAANLDLAGPGGGTLGPIGIIPIGQSNELMYCDHPVKPEGEKAAVYHYFDMLQQLTGIPTSDIHLAFRRSDFAALEGKPGATLYSGTGLYHFDLHGAVGEKWLEPVGHTLNDPSTWANNGEMTGFLAFLDEVQGQIGPDRPWMLDIGWDEYDAKRYDAGEIAVYLAARREFNARARGHMGGRPNSLVPISVSPRAYLSATRPEMMTSIRNAWHSMSQTAADNTIHGMGSALDADSMDGGNHWDWASSVRAARRTAIRHAKFWWANGYVRNDLSWLPTLGPRVGSIARVAGQSDALDLGIIHDKGTDLAMPPSIASEDYYVTSNGDSIAVNTAARNNEATIRLGLAAPLGSNTPVTFQYGRDLNFTGADRQITDNWHTLAKPTLAATVGNLGSVRMILQRSRALLTIS